MPGPRKAAAKKTAAAKKAEEAEVTAAPSEEEVVVPEAVSEAIDASAAAAQREAEARRDVAQALVDDGFVIVGAGEDEKGHWIEGKKYALTDGEEDETKRTYVEEQS